MTKNREFVILVLMEESIQHPQNLIKTRIDINFFKLNHWSTKTSLNQIDVTKDIKYEKKTNLES